MSDHADTIRRALDGMYVPSLLRAEALSALDALLAERQQAQQDISDAAVVYADLMTKWNECEAERQQARDERDDAVKAAYGMSADLTDMGIRCEQAIDALREIVTYSTDACQQVARAALLNLGEKP